MLDRVNKIAYAALSPRTDVVVLGDFRRQLSYDVISFRSRDEQSQAIYHTNVLMSLGQKFAVVCTESIYHKDERDLLLTTLHDTGKCVLEISLAQMKKMAANMLELHSLHGKPLIALSQQALNAFSLSQLQQLQTFATLVPVEIDIIEKVGGGSIRCMLAEIFH